MEGCIVAAYDLEDTKEDDAPGELCRVFGGGGDCDGGICPSGCRRRKNELAGCTETAATWLVGGIPAIMEFIESIESRASGYAVGGIETPGVNHGAHSILLPCEHCNKYSVCSFTNYQECMKRLPAGTAEEALHHRVMRTAAEYYLHIAITEGILTTPTFQKVRRAQPPAREGGKRAARTFGDKGVDVEGVDMEGLDNALKKRHRSIE